MQRWHVFSLLSVAAVTGAILSSTAPPSQASVAPVESATARVDVTATPIVVDAAETNEAAGLHLRAGLDRPAWLADGSADRFLVIEVGADEREGGEALPVDVTLVVDVSGSMGEQGKIEHARQAALDAAARG